MKLFFQSPHLSPKDWEMILLPGSCVTFNAGYLLSIILFLLKLYLLPLSFHIEIILLFTCYLLDANNPIYIYFSVHVLYKPFANCPSVNIFAVSVVQHLCVCVTGSWGTHGSPRQFPAGPQVSFAALVYDDIM